MSEIQSKRATRLIEDLKRVTTGRNVHAVNNLLNLLINGELIPQHEFEYILSRASNFVCQNVRRAA